MRILAIGNMYPPHHFGGYELTWRSAMGYLRASGHDVRVLTTDFRQPDPDPSIPEDTDVHRSLRWYWRDHAFPPIARRARVALERHNGWVLRAHLESFRPDVVNWWFMGGMSLSLIQRVARAGFPAVGVVGDDWMVYGPEVDAWTRLTRRLGSLGPVLGGAVGVPGRLDLSPVTWLFNSKATEKAALGSGIHLPARQVACPGIDDALFGPAPEHDWGWRLLYVGRLDERKGVEDAIEALALLPTQARLDVLGSGDESFLATLHDRCAELGLSDRVRFGTRPRAELATAYAEADVLLFPARWEEPWGLVPLESMAVGTPVVATGTGGSSEYLRHRENAMVVGRGAKPADLAAAVTELAGDSALRARLRHGGFATAPRYTERGYNAEITTALEAAMAGVS